MATPNIQKVHIGRGEMWIGGTAPTAGSDPNDPTTSALNAMTSGFAAPSSGGTYVGFTNGPATLTYKPTYYEVEVEQSFAPVLQIPTGEDAQLEFTMLQSDANNLAYAWGQGTTKHTAAPVVSDAIYLGSLSTTSYKLVTLYSPKQNTGVGYVIATLYQAYSSDGAPMTFERRKESQIKTVFKCLADLTRPIGDQLYQYVDYAANPA